MRRYIALAVVSLAAALALVGVSAQARVGTVAGTIRDASGTAVPGVTVSLVDTTGRSRSTASSATGAFQFSGLAPGNYTLSTTRSGFLPASLTAVVGAGVTTTLAVTLQADPRQRADTPTETKATESQQAPAPPPPAPVSAAVAGGVIGGMADYRATPMFRREAAFNTEAYDRIDDNQWTEVGGKPLSTFSIDVDTASYSNVRRYLAQGSLPPKDSVRIEELVNYFSYDYAEPRGARPFSIVTSVGEAPWNRRHRLALIGLQARHMDSGSVPPRNLVFLIDVSGSMAMPNKLPLVKSSLAMLARNLTEKDRLAIVVYAGAAGLVLPSTSGADTSTILGALSRLEAGGSTNGAQGIQLAYQVAQQHFVRGGVNRVVLATDGDFNVGVTSRGDLTRFIEEQRTSGISLSVLGFGMGNLKDSTMEALADRGNGNYSYIDSLNEAQKVLVEQAGGTLVTIAKDVKLQVEFNPRAVAAYRLIGYENRLLQDRDFNDDKKDAGDMGAGHSVTALYELIPVGETLDVPGIDPLKYQQTPSPSRAATLDELMTVKVRFKAPDADKSELTSVTVPARAATSPELGFASAVAEFSMLLRDSEHKGAASFSDVRTLAARFKGADPFGHRAEFLRLIDAAEAVSQLGSARK